MLYSPYDMVSIRGKVKKKVTEETNHYKDDLSKYAKKLKKSNIKLKVR